MKKTPKEKLQGAEMTTMRLPVELKRALKELAQSNRRTFSNYLMLVLEKHVHEAAQEGAGHAMPNTVQQHPAAA